MVVRALAAMEAADLGDKFMVIGTHAVYAYASQLQTAGNGARTGTAD